MNKTKAMIRGERQKLMQKCKMAMWCLW